MWDEFIKYMSGLANGGSGAPTYQSGNYSWMDGLNPAMDGSAGLNVPGMPAIPAGGVSGEPTFMQGLTGYTDSSGNKVNGWGGMALGAAQGLGSAYMGMKQFGLAQDTLEENKKQFALNYGAQKQLTNSMMEDRQRARVASNAGAYESVGDYMNKNKVR